MPDASDKRVKRVVLTGRIRPLLPELENVVEQIEEILLDGIPIEERDSLIGQLQRVRANLRQRLFDQG